MRLRTRCLALLVILVSGGCGSTTRMGSRDPTVRALAEQLELEGVIVCEEPGWHSALVASGPEAVVDRIAPDLRSAGIGWYGSCGLGYCGVYVDVRDFYEAHRILLKQREEKGLKEFWVWEPRKAPQ